MILPKDMIVSPCLSAVEILSLETSLGIIPDDPALKRAFPTATNEYRMMQLHLDEISKNVEEGFHAIVLMDRASWHTTEAMKIPINISLFPLPPYSPELNPMEQVWQKIKGDNLTNRAFKDYDDIVKSCVKAWNSFCDEEGNIKQLCSRAWAA
jgi:transposase